MPYIKSGKIIKRGGIFFSALRNECYISKEDGTVNSVGISTEILNVSILKLV